ncbi:MAG: 16S rRNA (uracil(1498)-N(3))-methyltransferase [Firmicutes bacterium]|nr:16S rRNA (uracil(1498)-N(3))-methyltransferase [Bacillota bacterium]
MARFFIQKEDIRGEFLRVQEDAHHILHVLRLGIGDSLTLCDGEGTDYHCVIDHIEGEELYCRVQSQQRADTEPEVEITLFQGIPKSDKMEWIIEKGVETGICRFVPVDMVRCVSKLEGKKVTSKVDRWNKISRAAAKQCQRGRIPQVEMPRTLGQCIQSFGEYDLVLICYEEQRQNSLKKILQEHRTARKVAVIIGPEGGLEAAEVERCVSSGAVIAGLGPRILRTETAGLVTGALVLYELNQM